MSKRPSVYLCGPIMGLQFGPANSWRARAEQLLAPEFSVLSPLRGKEGSAAFANGTTQFSDQFIVQRDLADLRAARAVLRLFDGTFSEGSAQETFYASRDLGLPVVTFGSDTPREQLSIWLRAHTVANVTSLEDAVAFIKAMYLLPGEEVEPPYDPTAYLGASAGPRRSGIPVLDPRSSPFSGRLSGLGPK